MSTQLSSVESFVAGRSLGAAPLPGGSRVVVVGSGKGGVGTSTVASLLALVLSARGGDVLLVDATDGHGAQHLLLGVEPVHALGALRGGELQPRDLVVPVSETLALVPAIGEESAGPALQQTERRALFRRLTPVFAGYGTVVIDGGSRLESVLAACEAGVGTLVTVTAADRICLAATYALVKAVGMRLADRPVLVVGNRLDDPIARESAALIDSATRHFLERSIEYAGSLPDDACLAAGVAAGMPIQEAAAGSPAASAMQQMVATLANLSPATADGPGAHHLSRR